MMKTNKDIILANLARISKKNKIYIVPMSFCALAVSMYYNIFTAVTGNTKRIVTLFCLLLFFTVGSSFAPLGLEQTEDSGYGESTENGVSGNVVRQEEMSMSEEENLDFESDDSVADRYSAEEILDAKMNVDGDAAGLDGELSAEEPVFDKTAWNLLLINKQHPIPEDYTFVLGTIKGAMQCDERIIDDLLPMLQGARAEGVNLLICSPYRDINRQEMLFNKKITAFMKKGMSYMEAYKVASQAVTVPGSSEHQVGLALDIVCDSYTALNAGFGDTEAGKWLAANCSEYGFILRYPKGKEYITSIEYEPWHFRYVGKEAAKMIMDQGITLEEFVESL